jgi:hypothetical protein
MEHEKIFRDALLEQQFDQRYHLQHIFKLYQEIGVVRVFPATTSQSPFSVGRHFIGPYNFFQNSIYKKTLTIVLNKAGMIIDVRFGDWENGWVIPNIGFRRDGIQVTDVDIKLEVL